MNKIEKAIETCENVLEGIESEKISASSALLQCLRIARLSDDVEAIMWLQYESGGYPRLPDGSIEKEAWKIGWAHGRGYIHETEKHIFLSLASELEEKIGAQKNAVNNFTTQGASVSGEYAVLAMNNLTNSVSQSTQNVITSVGLDNKRLSILKAQYYDYALRKHIEFAFGNTAEEIFSQYREKVDNCFSNLPNKTILKLKAIENKVNSDNPELYSQALTTCRRLFEDIAKELFDKNFPDYKDKHIISKSGAELDVSGNHYKNKLFAVIEKLEDKSPSKSIVGSNITYLLDWIDNLHNLQCKGVHAEISKQDAIRCIIQTYICLGDILNLQDHASEQ